MPRSVDHEQRRRHVADVVCAIVAEQGIGAATLRYVAERAGVSMGAVQRCFGTGEEMIGFALDRLNDGVTARIWAATEPAGPAAHEPPDVRAVLRAVAREIALLGAGADSARMWLAFHGQVTQAAVATRLRADEASALEALVTVIEYGRASGEIPDCVDVLAAARLLLATLDGVVVQRALGVLEHDTARALVDAATDQLWCVRSGLLG